MFEQKFAPQNNPSNIPLCFGDRVLVSIQFTLLPAIWEILGYDNQNENIRALLESLGNVPENISWNQGLWVPEKFGKFLSDWIFERSRVNSSFLFEPHQIIDRVASHP